MLPRDGKDENCIVVATTLLCQTAADTRIKKASASDREFRGGGGGSERALVERSLCIERRDERGIATR